MFSFEWPQRGLHAQSLTYLTLPLEKHPGTRLNADDVICYARPVLHSLSVRKKKFGK